MADLSQFINAGGGKLRYQYFTTSGTFTPSSKLLANGGQVFLKMAGGGGAGEAAWTFGPSSVYQVGGGGGSSYLEAAATVTGPVTVTIGAGGQAGRSPDNGGGNAITPGNGGDTSFGSVVCTGGRRGSGSRGGAAGSQGQAGFNGIYAANGMHDGNGGGQGGGGGQRISGEANTGGGGAGVNGTSTFSGAGGSGYCLVYWFE